MQCLHEPTLDIKPPAEANKSCELHQNVLKRNKNMSVHIGLFESLKIKKSTIHDQSVDELIQ